MTMKLHILIYVFSSVLLVLANEDEATGDKKDDLDKDNVISETQKTDNTNDIPEKIPISKLKVVQDNVSGNKHDSFSEDQNNNRDDEQTVSDIRKEAESRVIENDIKELEKSLNVQDSSDNDDKHDIHQEEVNEEKSIENADIDNVEDSNTEVNPDNTEKDINLLDLTKNSEEDSTTFPEIVDETIDTTPQDASPPYVDEEAFSVPSGDEQTDRISEEEADNTHQEQIDPSVNVDLEADSDLLDVHIDDVITSGDETPDSSDGVGGKSDSITENVEVKQDSESDSRDTNKTPDEEGIMDKVMEKADTDEDVALRLYKEAKSLGKNERKSATRLFLLAAEEGHVGAMEEVAYPLLFGDGMKANETKAYEYFKKLAEGGSPKGQQGLGFLFGTGIYKNSSQAKALIYTTFAALGGDTMAEMMLGFRHYSGTGVTKSCETALTYYKKVAKKVSDTVSLNIGGNAVQRVRLYDELEQPGGNTGQIDEDLLQYYQFLADKGDTQAQIGLGQLYFQGGRGVDINYQKAFHYFKLAADTGNGNGLAYLGKMYLQGLYVDKNPIEAKKHFEASLKHKNPVGQAGLGMLYLKGEGVEKDYDKALKYFSQSAEQGWVEGQLQLGNMYYNGIGVKKDYRQAVKYFTFASQSGHVLAFYNLAMMHTIGAGVIRSCNAATELFKNVAERGNWSMMFMDAHDAYKNGDIKTALMKYYFLAELGYEVAQSNVAYILDKGDVSFYSENQTYARALLQWSRAADQGYAVARVKLGDYHFYGLGTKVNYENAALHYRLASEKQGNAQALFNLGYMHEQGFGLKKDIHLAKRFYDQAAEASVDAQFPVYLALLKLAVEFGWEWLEKNYRFWDGMNTDKIQLYVMQNIGPDWDVYLIGVLTGLLGILLLYRRDIRRQR